MANGGWGGLGKAWGQSMAMDRRREEKERKKDRRNMWMMQLVGAPVAKGITEGVAGLINEPFKEPVLDFFSSEESLKQGLVSKDSKIKEMLSRLSLKDKDIYTSGTTGTSYHKKPLHEAGKAEVDAKFMKLYGPEYKKLASYSAALADLDTATTNMGREQFRQHELALSAARGAKSQAQKDRALREYNPYSKNWGQAGIRQVKRWAKGQSFEDYEKQRIDQYAKAAGLDDVTYNELITTLKDGVHIQDDDISRTVDAILTSHLGLEVKLKDGTVTRQGNDAQMRDWANFQKGIEEWKLYSSMGEGKLTTLLEQTAWTNAASKLSESQLSARKMPRSLYNLEITNLLAESVKSLTKDESTRLLDNIQINEDYKRRETLYRNLRAGEIGTQSALPFSTGQRFDKLPTADKTRIADEWNIAMQSTLTAAQEIVQADYYEQLRLPPNKRSQYFKNIFESVVPNERRYHFLTEINRVQNYLLDYNLQEVPMIPEGSELEKEGRSYPEIERTALILKSVDVLKQQGLEQRQREINDSTQIYTDNTENSVVSIRKTLNDTNKPTKIFNAISKTQDAALLKRKSWLQLEDDYRSGTYSMDELQTRLSNQEQALAKFEDMTYDPDMKNWQYPKGSVFEKIQSGVIYDRGLDGEVNRAVGPRSEFEELIGGPYKESQARLKSQRSIESSLQALQNKVSDLPGFFEKSTRAQRQQRDLFRAIGSDGYKELALDINASTFLTSEFNRLGAEQFVNSYVDNDGALLMDKISEARKVIKTEPWVNRYPPVEDSFAPESSEEEEVLTPDIEPEAELNRPPLGESFREAWSEEGYTPTETVAEVVDAAASIVFSEPEKKKILTEKEPFIPEMYPDASPSDKRPSLIAERKTPVEVNDTQKLAKALTEKGIQIDEIVTPFEFRMNTPLSVQNFLKVLKIDDPFNPDLGEAASSAVKRYTSLVESKANTKEPWVNRYPPVEDSFAPDNTLLSTPEKQAQRNESKLQSLIGGKNQTPTQALSTLKRIFPNDSNGTEFIKEIAIVESNMGTDEGIYEDQGGSPSDIGMLQINPVGYNTVMERLTAKRGDKIPMGIQSAIPKVKKELGIDLRNVKFEDLTNNTLNAIFGRLYLFTITDKKIPTTLEGRAKYWKDFYNSNHPLAKGKPSRFVEAVKYYRNK